MDVRASFSFFSYGFSHDVFPSFRGPDTRYAFTGNLCKALRDKGIRTFFDDDELERGEEITPALVKAMEGSRIAIPILSKNYAFSSFCLDELVHIVECFKANGRLVLPIFFGVDPSHVRYQQGSYGEAMAMHATTFSNGKVNLERLHKWKMALNQVANLSGYHYEKGDGYEHMFIGKIVEEVSRKIKRVALPLADYPVGLEWQVRKVNSLLDVGSDDSVHMVGIHGIGGIGKTTLAVAVYNFIADHFDGLCFLENIRENSSKHSLIHLQKILLSEILGEKNIELTSVRQGIAMMQHRFQTKTVLLILDDVAKQEQLQALCGRTNWFGPGSTIIITTRDQHLLECHGIKKMYEVKELNREVSLKLLQWKAFLTEEVSPSYVDVLNHVVTYACGLPLVLEVIGSNLFGKSVEEWKSALDQYKRVPNKEIQRILKISFDALEEDEKGIFLDIACCFKGYPLKKVEDILCAHHGSCMKYQIGVLVKKSLIKISMSGTLSLHDVLEDMGKEIVRRESPKEVGKRSRLWFSKDIIQVLKENSGTSKIEIICINFPLLEEEEDVVVEWNGEAFKKMTKLTTLIIRKGHFSTGPKHLPNSLRVLQWKRYPLHNLPSDFHPKNLVICKLPKNFLTSLEINGILKKFVNIKVLNFNRCPYLTHIDDVSGLPNLEDLRFGYCDNLITIHSSVGYLDKLKILKAQFCTNVRKFPPIKLTSLEHVNIQGCINLEYFPEIIGKMEKVKHVNFMGCNSLKEIPFSVRNLTGLQRIVLFDQQSLRLPSSIAMMPKLTMIEVHALCFTHFDGEKQVTNSTAYPNIECLQLRWCRLSETSFTSHLKWFTNIKELHITDTDLTIIPECIKEYHSLRTLIVNGCDRLREIRGIPPKLDYFSAGNCVSLTSSSTSMLLNQDLHESRGTEFYLPGDKIPNWFEHHGRMQLPKSFWFRNKFISIVLCLVIQRNILGIRIEIMLRINGTKHVYVHSCYTKSHFYTEKDHICILNLEDKIFKDHLDEEDLSENEWKQVNIEFKNGEHIKDIGIHVIKKEDIRFNNPYMCRKRKLDDLCSSTLL